MNTNPDNTNPDAASAASTSAEGHSPGEKPQTATGQSTEGQTAAAAERSPQEIIEELEHQKSDLTDRLLRTHAEMENLRKRVDREKAELSKFAISKFALDMVGVGDNFERAISAVPEGASNEDASLKSLLDGIIMTERAFNQALERHGVKRIVPRGEQFDPHVHQAVMEQEDLSVPSGSVLQVFQAGYVIDERVLRPAMVVVAKGGPKPGPSATQAGTPVAENQSGTEPDDGKPT